MGRASEREHRVDLARHEVIGQAREGRRNRFDDGSGVRMAEGQLERGHRRGQQWGHHSNAGRVGDAQRGSRLADRGLRGGAGDAQQLGGNRTNRSPAGVSPRKPPESRRTRGTPRSSSRRRMRLDSADTDTPRDSAARPKCRSAVTAMKLSTATRSTRKV